MTDADVKRREERPDTAAIRGQCPRCSRVVVSECHYISGKGYSIIWTCLGANENPPVCDWRQTL